MLREAFRVSGDVRVEFRGTGPARFRLQHTRTRGGVPDDLGWADVTAVSDGRLRSPEDAVNDDMFVGTLVDRIDGDTDVLYRRHIADWLRVVPFDEFDEESVKQCQAYHFAVVPNPKDASSSK